MEKGKYLGSLANDQNADSLRALEFMCRQGEQVNVRPLPLQGDFTGCLDRVAMEADAFPGGQFADFPDRKERAGLVVGVHG